MQNPGCNAPTHSSINLRPAPLADRNLVALLSRAHDWFDQLKSGHVHCVQAIAIKAGIRGDQATRIIHLAFLAPDLAARILRGDHPPDLNTTRLLALVPLSTDWAAHRALLGFAPAARD